MKLRHVDGFAVLVVVFLFVASMFSHAQLAGSNVQPLTQPSYSVPDHPMHASQGTLRPEQSLLASGSVTYAQGEQPVWQFGELKYERPLGDVAREFRDVAAMKPRPHSGSGRSPEFTHIYWEQQGSGK